MILTFGTNGLILCKQGKFLTGKWHGFFACRTLIIKRIHMKNKLLFITSLFCLCLNTFVLRAQWQTNGPYGGPAYAVQSWSGNLFVGTGNGVFISSNNGQTWNAANAGIERKHISALAGNSTTLFAAAYGSGVYSSTNNGANWTLKNNGLTDFYISSLSASDSGIYAGTSSGVFFSSDNGNSWSLTNNGIPATYVIYSFIQTGDTVLAGSYGFGLYRSINNGGAWTSVGNGFPANSFVYAMIADGSTIYAGTNSGIYKSTDNGNSWFSSNSGFPASMWAKSFAVKPGYIFAGTYSEGVFVSADGGNSWNPARNGIPDLPFPTGLPHNYPSVEGLAISGSNAIAATVNGVYLTTNNGSNWLEANDQILGTNITALAAGNSAVFSGEDRTGVYVTTTAGANWMRANNGLTSYSVLALTTKDSSVYAGVLNQMAFRSDDNGASWIPISSGLTGDPILLESDNISVLAVTSGAVMTPQALFRTFNKGVTWTQLTTSSFNGGITALASQSNEIYAGTTSGNLYYSNNGGVTWQDISAGLPSEAITSILIDNFIYAGTASNGVYRSAPASAGWTAQSSGMVNDSVMDLVTANGNIYAATWGGGVYMTSSQGASWSSYNSGLANWHTRSIVSDGTNLYVSTDAGTYSTVAPAGIFDVSRNADAIRLFPNPSSGIFHVLLPVSETALLTVYTVKGEQVCQYTSSGNAEGKIDLWAYPKGVYILAVKTSKGVTRKKIILE